MGKKRAAVLFTALLGGAALAGSCGSTAGQAASSSATTTTAAGPGGTTVPARAPTTTVPVTTTAPAGGAVPSGFDPVSFTAISPSEYWLLGDAPCANPVCTSIVRTTDGGSHFVGIPAPTSPVIEGTGASTTGVNTLRFADGADGYAFATGPGGAFWDTHDGGEQWAQPGFLAGRELLGFGTGGGYALAVVGTCADGSCSAVTLERAPVTSDRWSALSVPVPDGSDQLVSMAVHGSELWISVTTSARQANQLLVAGAGSGRGSRRTRARASRGSGGASRPRRQTCCGRCARPG